VPKKQCLVGFFLHFFSFTIVLVEMKKWRNKKLEGKLWKEREKKP
jgi:hypothetical protein